MLCRIEVMRQENCNGLLCLQVENVTIFGLGNVALDCARVLVRAPDSLASTDIAAHALEALRHSAVKRVDLVGRRGAVQVTRQPSMLRSWSADLRTEHPSLA